MRYARSMLDLVGDTPLVRLNHVVPQGDGAPLVLAKLEARNPGGSVKDRIGLSLIEAEEKAGRLKPGGTIVEGTSGNTGLGLALVAKARGYRVVFTMPDKMAAEKERLLRAYGAEVVRCPTNVEPDDPRSYYSVAARIARETPNAVYPNQYQHQANPEAHYRTTGPEIWRDTDGKVTHYIVGSGTGGTISGTGRFLKEKNPDIQVVGVDPVGSMLAHYHKTGEMGPAHGYKIEGIGEDLIPKATWFDVIDEFVTVDDQEAYAMALDLAAREGILSGSSAGAALAGVKKYIEAHDLGPDHVVVTLLPDTGERYLSKLYNPGWLRANGFKPAARRIGEVMMTPAPGVEAHESVRRILDLAIARVTPAVALVDADGQATEGFEVDAVRAAALLDPKLLDRPVRELAPIELPVLDAGEAIDHAVGPLQHAPAVLVTRDERLVGMADRNGVLSGMGHG